SPFAALFPHNAGNLPPCPESCWRPKDCGIGHRPVPGPTGHRAPSIWKKRRTSVQYGRKSGPRLWIVALQRYGKPWTPWLSPGKNPILVPENQPAVEKHLHLHLGGAVHTDHISIATDDPADTLLGVDKDIIGAPVVDIDPLCDQSLCFDPGIPCRNGDVEIFCTSPQLEIRDPIDHDPVCNSLQFQVEGSIGVLGLRIVIALRDQIEAGIGKYPIAGDQKSRTAADFCNIGRGDIYGGTSIFSDKVAAGIAMKDQTPFLHLGTDPFDEIFPTLDLHPMRTALFEDQVQVLKYGDLAKLGHVQNLPFGIPCI